MAIALTYTNHADSWMCMTLQTGDTLAASGGAPAVNGPATLYIPVSGDNNYYKQTVAQGLLATATHPARPPKPV
jgi:hypothetical protein